MISQTHSAAFTTWPWLARSRARQLALALLALVVLLVTFQQVVTSSVRQGAERRAESAALTDATWRRLARTQGKGTKTGLVAGGGVQRELVTREVGAYAHTSALTPAPAPAPAATKSANRGTVAPAKP